MSDKLAKAGTFAALVPAEGDFGLQDIVNINMGGNGVDPSMLDRVKVPSGGALSWEVPGLDGEPEPKKELTGVVVGVQNIRSYYKEKYDGGNEPPNCASKDGIYGIPDVPGCGYGGRCSDCPMSQWGSNEETGGQACSQRKLLMVLPPEAMLPFVMNVPPTSVREVDKYLLRLTSKKVPYFHAVSSFKLVKERSKSGIDYAKISPSFIRLLDEEEKVSAFGIYKGLAMVFSQVAEETSSEIPY
jgi:hypothetical protein